MQWCLPPLWHLPWQSPLSVQPPDEWESTYHFSKSFLLRSIIQKEPKRDPPVPPAAVVQVHWLSTQWSSAPPEQVVVVQSPSLLHVSAYTESILSFDLYNGVKMQRFHSWTHYPRNRFFYAERKKNIKKCTVCHFCLAWNWWNLKKKIEKFINIYTMNCFTLDLGRENTQSIYSSTILFSAISFTINMHVQHTYTLSSISWSPRLFFRYFSILENSFS